MTMDYQTFRNVLPLLGLLASASVLAQDLSAELQLSTDEEICWYRICSAVPAMTDFAMTDVNAADAGKEQEDLWQPAVYLLQTETADHRSQWKLTAGEDGKVVITNRATGNSIGSISMNAGNHNVTQLTPGATPGFTVTDLDDNAFKLESVEDDGVNRCLALAKKHSEALAYPEADESASVVGWKFLAVEIDTGLGSTTSGRTVVRVADGRIAVENCTDWMLFNALGEQMPRTVSLPTGVYLVKLPQKTVKILVH